MRWLILSAVAIATLYGGCTTLSDGEYAQKQARKRRARALVSMKESTAQTPRGRDVKAEELEALVSGRTHIFIYGKTPSGGKGPYITYHYYRPDGQFVFLNTESESNFDGREGDHWRVDGNRLCVIRQWYSHEEGCFRLAVLPNGRVQYYIDDPGGDYHGLLTTITDEIQEGPPQIYRQP